MTSIRASVVVNTFNRLSTLPTTLRALEALRWPELEVVVVNGPSDDGTDLHLDLFWKDRVKIINCPVANLSVSRNLGIEASSGEVVVFIDDDAVPEPDWLNRLLMPYADPAVGAVGGWVRDQSGVSYQAKHIQSFRTGNSNTLLTKPAQATEDSFVGLIGVNSSIRRTVAVEIGGFDERFSYLLDETDLVLRVQEAGYQVRSVPEAEVHHKFASSHIRPADPSKATMLQTSSSVSYFIMRHGPTRSASLDAKSAAVELAKDVAERTIDPDARLFDEVTAARLKSEVEIGTAAGISGYFDGPILRTLSAPKSSFKTLSRRMSAPLRLAFVCDAFFPRQVGGIGVVFGELARELAHKGHEITLVAPAQKGAGHTVDFEDGVWVHRLPPDAPIAEAPGLPDLPPQQALLAKQVLAELDRVNIHRDFAAVIGTIWNLDLAAVIASGRYKVGMYLVTSYLLLLESKPEWRANEDFYRDRFLKMVEGEKWALRSADRIFASTQAILSDITHHYGVPGSGDARVSMTPFGLPDFAQPTKRAKGKDVVVTFVGRLENRKGIDLLLGAIPELMSEHDDLQVRIVGQDRNIPGTGVTYSDSFFAENGTAPWIERVRFLGYLDDEGVREEFERCDIFVAPSRYESFGLIYVEAMRAAKPCVGVRSGGVPEIIDDGVTGILVDPDVASLGDALSCLILDRARRTEMGRAGRRRFEALFSMDAFCERFSADISQWLELEEEKSHSAAST